jgi:hypothetical protein
MDKLKQQMNNRSKQEDHLLKPDSAVNRYKTSGTIHPSRMQKVQGRILDGYYSRADVLREIANRILKLCR